MSERVVELARKILDVRKQKRILEANLELFKEEIHKEMLRANKGEIVISLGDGEEIIIRNSVRHTKPFDKDGFAEVARVDRSDLDYAEVARLVDSGAVRVEDVEKYQGKKRAEFVTVRVRKQKKKSKKV